jgi:hypothetical protein
MQYGLYLGLVGDADETFLDGHFIVKTGDFPPNYINAKNRARLYYLAFDRNSELATIDITVYSDFPIKRGIDHRIAQIGDYSLLRKIAFRDDIIRTWALPFVLSVLLLTLLLGFSTWFLDPSKKSRLFAVAVTFFTATYTFCLSRYGYEFGFPNLWNYKGIALRSILVIASIAMFTSEQSKNRISVVLKVLALCNFIFTFFVLQKISILEVRRIYQLWYTLSLTTIMVVGIQFWQIRRTVAGGNLLVGGTVFFLLRR